MCSLLILHVSIAKLHSSKVNNYMLFYFDVKMVPIRNLQICLFKFDHF